MPTPIDLGLVRDTITGAIYKGNGTAGTPGQTDEYALATTLTPNGVGSFLIHNGENGVGIPAGFGLFSTAVTTTQTAAGSSAGVSASVTESGPNTAKNLDFSFSFSIPRGSDGVMTSGAGAMALAVDVSTGQLLCYSPDTTSNKLYLVSDDPNSPSYYVTLGLDASYVGHLVYSYGG